MAAALIIIIVIIAILWVGGRMIWSSQDQKELNLNPNHPSKLSSKMFPIGSGSCPARGNDRHIWDYGHYDDSNGPLKRYCKHCGKSEYRYMTADHGWMDSRG